MTKSNNLIENTLKTTIKVTLKLSIALVQAGHDVRLSSVQYQ